MYRMRVCLGILLGCATLCGLAYAEEQTEDKIFIFHLRYVESPVWCERIIAIPARKWDDAKYGGKECVYERGFSPRSFAAYKKLRTYADQGVITGITITFHEK
jgi:hypothetical protein